MPLHLEAEQPGDLVQLDCFHIGRLSGTKGRVWQYTAIDVASSFVWAQVHRSPKANPSARYATALVRRVAKELAAAGWRLKAITTDNGQEFRSLEFQDSVRRLGVEQRFIRAGRPQTNGAIERVQRTILETLLCHVKAPFGLEKPEDLASYVSLETAADLGLGLAFRGSSFDVFAGLRMVSEAA